MEEKLYSVNYYTSFTPNPFNLEYITEKEVEGLISAWKNAVFNNFDTVGVENRNGGVIFRTSEVLAIQWNEM
jgi:hypothetical protein